MLKIFDKVFSTAPFLHYHLKKDNIQRSHLFVLNMMVFFSILFHGYIIIIHFFVAYIVAFCIVWVYQIFNKSLFFSSEQWKISLLTYILILSPHLSLYANILGVGIMFIFGAGILSINGKPIINPVLLGVLSSLIINISYQNIPFFTIPYLTPMILEANTQLGNNSLIQAIIDANHLIAGFPNQSFLGQTDPLIFEKIVEQYTQNSNVFSQTWLNMVAPRYSFWFQSGSIALIVFAYIILSFSRVINALLPLIYLLAYTLVLFLLKTPNYYIEDLFSMVIFESSLWFTAVFLVTSPLSLPMNKKGSYIFTVLVACVTALLNSRNFLVVNYIFALIILNVGSSLIELLFKAPIFGVKSTKESKDSPFSFNHIFFKRYTMRVFIGILMISCVAIINIYIPDQALGERNNRYYQDVVEDIFPEYTLQQSYTKDNIYQLIDDDGQIFYVAYSQAALYRTSTTLLVLIQDDKIVSIKTAFFSTAHSYFNDNAWLEKLTSVSLDQLPLLLEEQKNQQSLNTSSLVIEVLTKALLNSKSIYEKFSENIEEK